MIVILGPFFGGRLQSDGSMLGNAQTLAKMRYVTSVIIHQLVSVGGLALCLRKLLKLSAYSDRVGGLLAVLRELHSSQVPIFIFRVVSTIAVTCYLLFGFIGCGWRYSCCRRLGNCF